MYISLNLTVMNDSDRSNRMTYSVGQSSTMIPPGPSDHTGDDQGDCGSGPSSTETTYIQSGESTKTVVSLDQSGTLKAEDLANRLEALSDQMGKGNQLKTLAKISFIGGGGGALSPV